MVYGRRSSAVRCIVGCMGHETLTALDATFLELEEADASAHMHIGAILVFDGSEAGGAPDLGALRIHLAQRLGALPRYRQRLSSTHVGRLGWPSWQEDLHFDIARHVHRAVVPAPGGWDELLEWAEHYFSQRLDRTQPLWEIVLLDGLADGQWALCTKTHHCLVDGVGSVDVAEVMLDGAPDGGRPAVEPPPAAQDDDGTHLAWPDWIPGGRLVHASRAGIDLALHPARAGGLVRQAIAVADLLVREEVRGAPSTSLNQPIGGRRRLRSVRFELEDARRVKAALGGTVNDVALAGVTGGLRALLLARGEKPPAQGLRAMVPMNLRTEDQQGRLGNRVTSLFVELPVDEPEPLARFAKVVDRTSAVKSSDQALGSDTMIKLAALAPPILHTVLAQSLFGRRLFNITVTNVPGSPLALYAFGAPLRAVYPLVPLAAEHAVGVAITSYAGQLSFGIVTDYDTVPDVDVLAGGVAAALEDLRQLAAGSATAV